MKRREFLTLVAGAAGALPLALRAQQKAMPVVGYLSSFSPPADPSGLSRGPFHQGLAETGFVERQNMISEYRWAEGVMIVCRRWPPISSAARST
jgi:putative tryptophan/tyrosine transport system substrate-binding protein